MGIVDLPSISLIPSALYTVTPELAVRYRPGVGGVPKIGDVFYAEVVSVGQHEELESRSGRVHSVIVPGYRFLVVFGNRYATDAYEARVPTEPCEVVDLVSRSGMVGVVHARAQSRVAAPTRLRLVGRVLDGDNQPVNTLDHALVHPRGRRTSFPRARMVLIVGTSMNAGKSTTAVAVGRALMSAGYTVKSSKVTGTASLKEILNMQDAGAVSVSDFSFLGYPSTYLVSRKKVLSIFHRLDRSVANNPEHFWVVEVADGVMQRESAMLLASPEVQRRIDRLVLCASDACGALGAIAELKGAFGLSPHLISGVVGSTPLARAELVKRTDIPICDARQADTRWY